jgi:hypothetical protein
MQAMRRRNPWQRLNEKVLVFIDPHIGTRTINFIRPFAVLCEHQAYRTRWDRNLDSLSHQSYKGGVLGSWYNSRKYWFMFSELVKSKFSKLWS